MICKNCNVQNNDDVLVCVNCGENLEMNSLGNIEILNGEKMKKNKNYFLQYRKIIFIIIGLLMIIFVIIGIFYFFNKEDRKDTLSNLKKREKNAFVIENQKFYLGQKVSDLKKNGLTYDDINIKETDYIVSDSFTVYTFYYDEEPVFLGALYCPKKENCKYDDAILIKANFYDEKEVSINNFLEIGLSYSDVKEKYGKEDDKFYQDKSMKVWSFGKEVGDVYYLVKFNDFDKVEEIRIGVWWYEEEYEYTID